MGGSNYQRGVEPWEVTQQDERPKHEPRDAAPKTDRQKRRERELRYQWLLFAMIALTLGSGIAHLLLEGVPFSLLSTFSAVLRIDMLKENGLFYSIFQVCSAMSCIVAWLAIRAPIAYPIGLLALPVLLMLGWLLQSLKLELGSKLMLTVLILAELTLGLMLLTNIATVLIANRISTALLQTAYYLALFLYPLFELIVLRKWKENIY